MIEIWEMAEMVENDMQNWKINGKKLTDDQVMMIMNGPDFRIYGKKMSDGSLRVEIHAFDGVYHRAYASYANIVSDAEAK
jgi:uncharacterized protein (DUF1015 family)